VGSTAPLFTLGEGCDMSVVQSMASRASRAERPSVVTSPANVLFLALFASQTGVLVLSPILADVAAEFDVSIAKAGQLRILAVPLAAVVAIVAGGLLVRLSPRALLVVGSALLAAGSLASAVAPTFHLLALAQVPTWAGIAILLAAGVAATAAWSEPGERTTVVARALAGPPTAWIVGMPVVGLVAEIDWRLTFVALPVPAALLAGAAALGRPRDTPLAGGGSSLIGLLGRRDARRWALGELIAHAAWAGTLVFSGALFTEVHGASATATGIALALVAGVYLAGNQWAARADPARAHTMLLQLSVAGAAAVGLTWAFAPNVAVTLVVFGAAGFVLAARTVSGTVYGFAIAGDLGREVGTVRAATAQVGYLIGSLVGGGALAIGGFEALGIVFGGMLLASAFPYVRLRSARSCSAAVQPAH
jgi:predicted MFS family arabinose efflux permease